MHAIGAADERDVEPIVDDDERRRSASDADRFRDQIGKTAGVQVALPNLDEIDAGVYGFANLRDDTAPDRGIVAPDAEPAAIGDQAEDGRGSIEHRAARAPRR